MQTSSGPGKAAPVQCVHSPGEPQASFLHGWGWPFPDCGLSCADAAEVHTEGIQRCSNQLASKLQSQVTSRVLPVL